MALTPGHESAQFILLANHYFQHGFEQTSGGMQRLDPQDSGPPYRNVVGIPGDMGGKLFPFLEAANLHAMPLVQVSQLAP